MTADEELIKQLADALKMVRPPSDHPKEWNPELHAATEAADAWLAQYEEPIDLDKVINDFCDDYEFSDGDHSNYVPTEFESFLIKDAIMGLLADENWDATWGKHIDSLAQNKGVNSTHTPSAATDEELMEALSHIGSLESAAAHLRRLVKSNADLQEELDLANSEAVMWKREATEALINIEHLESTIDQVLDLVLGDDRPEWSSAYGYGQALVDVEERMVALEKAKPESAPVATMHHGEPCVMSDEDNQSFGMWVPANIPDSTLLYATPPGTVSASVVRAARAILEKLDAGYIVNSASALHKELRTALGEVK